MEAQLDRLAASYSIVARDARTGVALANSGRPDQARNWLAQAFRDSDVWRELGRWLREAGLYAGDPSLLEP